MGVPVRSYRRRGFVVKSHSRGNRRGKIMRKGSKSTLGGRLGKNIKKRLKRGAVKLINKI